MEQQYEPDQAFGREARQWLAGKQGCRLETVR